MAIVGIDEVGRGCWAGPLVAGAVILNDAIPGIRDSKKLTKLQRTKLDAEIRVHAEDFSLGWVWPKEIDTIGLSASVELAMRRAYDQITAAFDGIIIDGNINYLSDIQGSKAVIRADDTVPAVSAASILAKVARDKYMADIAGTFGGYGFDHHVGYGTALHLAQLQKLGACEQHRKSFQPVKQVLLGMLQQP